MMKDVYTRKEVIEITQNYASQIARLRRQLDDNARKFAKMMHESVDLAWMLVDNDDEDEYEVEESYSCN